MNTSFLASMALLGGLHCVNGGRLWPTKDHD